MDRFRRQVTRDLLLEIRSDDGARQQYQLHAAARRLTLPRHRVQRTECTLTFPSARVGLRILLSRRAIGRLVEDMNGAAGAGMSDQVTELNARARGWLRHLGGEGDDAG